MAEHRRDARDQAARILRRSREEAGYSREQVADALGVSPSYIDELEATEGQGAVAVTLRDVLACSRALPRLIAPLAREMAATVGARRPSGVHPACLAANAMGELGDVAREVRAAFADGHLSDEERQRLRAEWLELRAVVDAAVGDLEAKGEE